MRALGASRVSAGSLDDVDAIVRAAQGARAIYHICPNVSPYELPFARAAIAGISRAGVTRLIYHSAASPNPGYDHIGATYELVGTAALSQTEVANIIGGVLGKPVVVEEESAEAWSARARNAGMGDYQCDALLRMFRYYGQHGLVGNSNELRWRLRREPTALASFIERVSVARV